MLSQGGFYCLDAPWVMFFYIKGNGSYARRSWFCRPKVTPPVPLGHGFLDQRLLPQVREILTKKIGNTKQL